MKPEQTSSTGVTSYDMTISRFRVVEIRPFAAICRPGRMFALETDRNRVEICGRFDETQDLMVFERIISLPQFIIRGAGKDNSKIEVFSPTMRHVATINEDQADVDFAGTGMQPCLSFAMNTQPYHHCSVRSLSNQEQVGLIYFHNGHIRCQIPATVNWLNALIVAYGINKALTTYKQNVMENEEMPTCYDSGISNLNEFRAVSSELLGLLNSPIIELRPNMVHKRKEKMFQLIGANSVMYVKMKGKNDFGIFHTSNDEAVFSMSVEDQVIFTHSASNNLLGSVHKDLIYYRSKPSANSKELYRFHAKDSKTYDLIECSGSLRIASVQFHDGMIRFVFCNAKVWMKALVISFGIAQAIFCYKATVLDKMQSRQQYQDALKIYTGNPLDTNTISKIKVARSNLLPNMRSVILRGVVKNDATHQLQMVLMKNNKNCKPICLIKLNTRLGIGTVTDQFGNYLFDIKGFLYEGISVQDVNGPVGRVMLKKKSSSTTTNEFVLMTITRNALMTSVLHSSTRRMSIFSGSKTYCSINPEDSNSSWAIELDDIVDNDSKMVILSYVMQLAAECAMFKGSMPENNGVDFRCQCTKCRMGIITVPGITDILSCGHMSIRGAAYMVHRSMTKTFDLYSTENGHMINCIDVWEGVEKDGTADFKILNGTVCFSASGLRKDGPLCVTLKNGHSVGYYENNIFYNNDGKKIMALAQSVAKQSKQEIYVFDECSGEYLTKFPIMILSTRSVVTIQMKQQMDSRYKILVLAYVMRLIDQREGCYEQIGDKLPLVNYASMDIKDVLEGPIHFRLK